MAQGTEKRLTKNERREQARERARLARETQLKKEKQRKRLIQGGVVLGVIAVLVVIGLIIAQAVKPAGPGPRNMASGGVVFEGEDLSVRTTPAIQDGEQLVAQDVNRDGVPLDIVVYVDYLCPHCGTFEQQAGQMLEQWVGSGQATLQIYPMNIQDNFSQGTRYSTRAANAFACVVEESPDAAWKFHSTLLAADIQPAQGTSGLPNDRLIELAIESGADDTVSLRQCINNVPFADFFTKTTRQALQGPLVGVADDAPEEELVISGTPTVYVNGRRAPAAPAELEQHMLKLFGELTGAEPLDEDEADETDEGAN